MTRVRVSEREASMILSDCHDPLSAYEVLGRTRALQFFRVRADALLPAGAEGRDPDFVASVLEVVP